MGFMDRLQHAWNAFANRDPTQYTRDYGMSYGYNHNPSKDRVYTGSEKTIISSIQNRIALDVASLDFRHVKLDKDDRYLEDINSSLNNCLTLEANIDQTSDAFLHDAVYTMLEEGVVALVPIDASLNPEVGSFDIKTMRVGKIKKWYPQHVQVEAYNEITGKREEITVPKHMAAIIENPFYAVMNEPNSTFQRLKRKLALLDAVDEQVSSGKLELLIQLPYVVKNDVKRQQANDRVKDIEMQLSGGNNKYGIAYIDGTEKVTQLNRPLENQLLKQIEYLTSMVFTQLGINQAVLDGTADEKGMLNYNNRIIEPIATRNVKEMRRKWLSKTARSQKQSIMFFRDPFKLVPVEQMAEIADKFTRNEIMSKNEIRQKMGVKPSDDPKADMLINSNLNQTPETLGLKTPKPKKEVTEEENQNG